MYRIFLIGTFTVFLILRVIAFFNVSTFEDHDSIQYLTMIRSLVNGDFQSLFSYNPDKTFLFPILGSIFYPFTNSIEVSARLVSLSSNIILFVSFYLISIKLTNRKITLIALFLFAIHPLLINHSIGIITEPLYVSIIYFGFYILIKYLDNPSIKYIIIMSLVFSLSFLNRTEGITFLVFVPAALIFIKLFKLSSLLGWRKTISDSIIYVILFCIIISPQIIRVSSQLGEFAINGRQVWQLLLNNNDGRNYNSKIRGLDYSSSEVNLTYLMKHPEERAKFSVSSSISNYFENAIVQLKEFFSHKIFVLFGKLEVLLLLIGAITLFQKQFRFSRLMIFPFLILVFIPPLLHDVDVRHILILIPIMIIIISLGINTIANYMSIMSVKYFPLTLSPNMNTYLVTIIMLLLVYFKYPHIKKVLITPSTNTEYVKDEIIKIAKHIPKNGEHNRRERIASVKTYLPYFAEATYYPFPFTTYKKLVEYCRLNSIDYVFMDYRNMKDFEVCKNFLEHNVSEFTLVYSMGNSTTNRLELYKFNINKRDRIN